MRPAELFVATLVVVAAWNARAVGCETTDDRDAIHVSGSVTQSDDFRQTFGHDWTFALEAVDHGWMIRVLDPKGRMDSSAVTPPFGSPTNPRAILGWHFRNAENSGPNAGDVNAPQHRRDFFFSTRGDRANPSTREDEPRLPAPDPSDGRGWLQVTSMDLSPPAPSERARILRLSFEACLTRPRDAGDAAFPTPGDHEIFGACGLDLDVYALDAAFAPGVLMSDLDGDGSFDHLAQIRRRSDGRRGLVICRAGTWTTLVGFENATLAELPSGSTFDSLEAWRIVPRDHGAFGYVGEPAWPAADGDVVVLERIEKEMTLLYWRDGALRSQLVYRFVEP